MSTCVAYTCDPDSPRSMGNGWFWSMSHTPMGIPTDQSFITHGSTWLVMVPRLRMLPLNCTTQGWWSPLTWDWFWLTHHHTKLYNSISQRQQLGSLAVIAILDYWPFTKQGQYRATHTHTSYHCQIHQEHWQWVQAWWKGGHQAHYCYSWAWHTLSFPRQENHTWRDRSSKQLDLDPSFTPISSPSACLDIWPASLQLHQLCSFMDSGHTNYFSNLP